jgi:hypothetical protein
LNVSIKQISHLGLGEMPQDRESDTQANSTSVADTKSAEKGQRVQRRLSISACAPMPAKLQPKIDIQTVPQEIAK